MKRKSIQYIGRKVELRVQAWVAKVTLPSKGKLIPAPVKV